MNLVESYYHLDYISFAVKGLWGPKNAKKGLGSLCQKSHIIRNDRCRKILPPWVNKGDVQYLFGSARFLAPDVKTASFELDLIWGQVIITVFHEDSEYVISFAVPQTAPNSHLTLTQLSPNSRPTLANRKFEFRMIWAFIWYTYWYVTKTLAQLSPNSHPTLAQPFEVQQNWLHIQNPHEKL